jgi:uncharacterized phage-associated protein
MMNPDSKSTPALRQGKMAECRIDVRGIANFALEIAKDLHLEVSNMAINKIVYFMYSDFLLAFSRPLTSSKIEAWKHGPVFRELYHQFSKHGDGPIKEAATRIDPMTGSRVICTMDRESLSRQELNLLTQTALQTLPLSAAKLRQLSHVAGGPWDRVWNHDKTVNTGMQITDEIILEYSRDVRS